VIDPSCAAACKALVEDTVEPQPEPGRGGGGDGGGGDDGSSGGGGGPARGGGDGAGAGLTVTGAALTVSRLWRIDVRPARSRTHMPSLWRPADGVKDSRMRVAPRILVLSTVQRTARQLDADQRRRPRHLVAEPSMTVVRPAITGDGTVNDTRGSLDPCASAGVHNPPARAPITA
jgi:hypothetical protein